ncbi:MAG: molybdenum cofactor biosynthesis protein MoaE [Phycisphaerales bacterium]|nr:molybdenum cofactor biosynthesis protein MoaE [Phycisphaerales bacterium]
MKTAPAIEVVLSEGPLGPEDAVRAPGAGAIVAFEGVIRPTEEGREIAAIEYEAYRPMAENQLESLARAAADRFGLAGVFVRHSVGVVPVGECSFRLVVASAHRAPALEGMAWFIDTMKRDVPIWKRPVFKDAQEQSR